MISFAINYAFHPSFAEPIFRGTNYIRVQLNIQRLINSIPIENK